MLRNYIKTAWRSLWKNKATSFLNITGLSVGMTAAVMIFLWVQNEISFDRYHNDVDRIYRMTTRTTDKNWIWEGSAGLLADLAKNDIPQIEQVARLYPNYWSVFNIGGNVQYERKCAHVDYNWFRLFQYHFIEGGAAAFDQSPYSVILTASEAKKYFGTQEALGKWVRIDSINYEIKGIVTDAPSNSSFQYRAYMPIAAMMTSKQQMDNINDWGQTDYLSFVKFRKNFPVPAATKRLTEVFQKYAHDDEHSIAITVEALTDMHFENDLQGSSIEHGNINAVYLFSILGLLILLVACINYVNLTTAKASLRSKEVSIRKIVGAERSQLFYQFVAESFLVSLISLAFTILLIQICLPYFNAISEENFTLPLSSLDLWKVLGSALLLAFLLNSIYPALLLSSFKPLNIFRGISILKVKDSYFRKGLVVFQFCISIFLITGTIVIFSQMHFIQKSDPGYDRSQVLNVGIPPNVHPENRAIFMQTIKEELLSKSSIESASVVNQPIVEVSSATTAVDWDGRDTSFRPKVTQLCTDAELQNTMHLKMVAGRWFEPSGESDNQNFILNQTAVRELNIQEPVIGRRFSLHNETGRIIGVAKDFNYKNMHEKTGALVIFNNANKAWWQNFFLIRTAPKNAEAAVRALDQTWKKMIPGIPLEYSFLDERFNDLYKKDQQSSELILVFALIAVFISALGLFGLAAFAAEQRNKEIGIRKVLGATIASIGALLSWDFVKLVSMAIIIASPLAWWAMNKWLENFAYRINMSWWMIVLSGSLAVLIALVTVGFHAVKAAVANPVRSLRPE